jgi:hypothetical protein
MSATTLVPFLYQTRTLTRASNARLRVPIYRLFSQTAIVSKNIEARSTKLRRYEADHAIPFELPPDLEITEAEAGETRKPKRKHDVANDESDPSSTITPSERETFNRIFQEIAARRLSSSPRPGVEVSEPEIPAIPNPFESDPERGQAAINIIIQDAASNAHGRKSDRLGFRPLGQMSTAREREKALFRFPGSLRRAAREVMGMAEPNRGDKADGSGAVLLGLTSSAPAATGFNKAMKTPIANPTSDGKANSRTLDSLAETASIELGRRKEFDQVKKIMDAARSDFVLWDIMEKKVFSMVKRLGISEAQLQAKRNQRAQGKKREAPETVKAQEPELSMDFWGPLYPELLVYSLTLLDQRFPRSSPLAFNVLPRIKELGMASYVLGVSTSFYNVLIGIHWRRYGDSQAVFELLEEMRQAGLYFDENTKRVLDQMVAQVSLHSGKGAVVEPINPWDLQWKDSPQMDATSHPFLHKVATMPEFELSFWPRWTHWAKAVDMSIKERNREVEY